MDKCCIVLSSIHESWKVRRRQCFDHLILFWENRKFLTCFIVHIAIVTLCFWVWFCGRFARWKFEKSNFFEKKSKSIIDNFHWTTSTVTSCVVQSNFRLRKNRQISIVLILKLTSHLFLSVVLLGWLPIPISACAVFKSASKTLQSDEKAELEFRPYRHHQCVWKPDLMSPPWGY